MIDLPKIEYLFDSVKEYDRKKLVDLYPVNLVKHGRHVDIHWIREALCLTGKENVLEFGAWPCDTWKAIYRSVHYLTISDSFWWARERWNGEDGHPTIREWREAAEMQYVATLELDIQKLDFKGPLSNYEELYDAIYSVSVLEHVHDDELALRNIFRALKPGGMLAMTVEMNPYVGMEYDPVGCYRVYTPGEIINKMVAAGFQVNPEQEDFSEWEEQFQAAVKNPSLLRKPYQNFASTGIAVRKPE